MRYRLQPIHARSARSPLPCRTTSPGKPHTERARRMGRTVLVDGYNVIRRDPVLARLERTSLDLALHTLLACINSSPQFRHDEVTVVFDGAGSREAGVTGSRTFRRGRVRVMFSP